MNRSDAEEIQRIDRARATFFGSGEIEAGTLDETIVRSWQRCLSNALDADQMAEGPCLGDTELREARQRNERLVCCALPELEHIHQQIAQTNSTVILTDADGILLYRMGDPEFHNAAERVALQPGACWREAERGTNAIGTALAQSAPVSVHGPEHYLACNGFLTCAASPIRDASGRLLGVIDISGDQVHRPVHDLGLVRMATLTVENRLLESAWDDAVYLYFHPRSEFLGTVGQGIAVFSSTGDRLLALNDSARTQLGLDPGAQRRIGFADLFRDPFERVAAVEPYAMEPFTTTGGMRVMTRVVYRRPAAGAAEPAPADRSGPRDALDRLHAGDTTMKARADRARRVVGKGVAVLIEGETGTGKERFAAAMHAVGERRNGPFVAVDCGALPESLIEAELFGYVDGAFTGARRGGATGTIRQADGGTLFLDEIGDMPLSLQTRLLRVLQERRVTPVGGREAVAVEFDLISATHRHLGALVERGAFRQDLYYRINGLRIGLPPLRERTDLGHLIAALLVTHDGDIRLDPACHRLLAGHAWPGNIRELENTLRSAAALCGPGGTIGPEHLPPDLIAGNEEEQARTEPSSLANITTAAMQDALAAHDGNYSAAARALGIHRSTLYRRLRWREPGATG